VTGTLFRVLLLADQRFACVTDAFGGADPAALDAARDALLPSLVGSATAGELIASTGIGRLADALTWGGALLELTIAVLFFAPLPPRPERLRHVGLIGFCVVTYALAPVAGFGWLLLAMGLSQCPPAARGLRGAYGAAFVILLAEDVLLAAKP
jgi:hypothetical protein